jgi:hypothetical protein
MTRFWLGSRRHDPGAKGLFTGPYCLTVTYDERLVPITDRSYEQNTQVFASNGWNGPVTHRTDRNISTNHMTVYECHYANQNHKRIVIVEY